MTNNNNFFLDSKSDDIKDTYLTFSVGTEHYAVNINYVTEIVGMQKISEVPDVPPFIKGVTNLRGNVVAVMDVRLRFGLPWRDYDDRTTIIVLELDGVSTGLVVDRVNEVLDIQADQINLPPHWHSNGDQGVIKGLGKTEEDVYIILDTRRLLNDRRTQLDISQEIAQVAHLEMG
ncbi:MAG: purine-binding chemotaxis protein CheW [Anaerolineae bacterium]|nr:purine-binding chemotaxis protein CheW [Anaerolineae bacterium]